MSSIMKTKPYSHQKKEYEDHWLTLNRAIFWEQGTGKSKLIIDTACRLFLEGYINCIIVIAPKGVHRNWVSDELPAHMWDSVPYKSLFWRGGHTKREQQELAQLAIFPHLKFLAINYQALYDRKKPRSTKKLASKAKEYLKEFLGPKTFLVLDESTAVKTPGSKTSRTLWALSDRCKRKRIMSGQPVTRAPLDLYAQFRILDRSILGCKTFQEFKSRYALIHKMDNYEIITGYRNLKEMRDNYTPHMTRILKKDCLDLPKKLPPIKRYFELTPKQNKYYEELAESFLIELDTPCNTCHGDRITKTGSICKSCTGTGTIINASLAVVRRLRFQQITCGFVRDENKQDHSLCDPNPRIQLLRECLKDLNTPGIIWAWQHYDLASICQMLISLKISYVEYSGRVSDEKKAEAKVKFQNKGIVQILLASQASAYSGHTFHRAEWNIYYSQTDNGEHRWQSEDRSHRAGLKHPVSYIDFYSDKPIENAIMKNLLKKKAYNELMMGDIKLKSLVELTLSKEEMKSWII